MSMHKTPLTDIEKSGIEAFNLPIGSPSQLSDSFRSGVIWALKNIELGSDAATHVLSNLCDGSYSQEDHDLMVNELKHVETFIQNKVAHLDAPQK
ncbi:hypothetical protein tloyanaT_25820 [Thalassotalea loyana]|uniref:DUF3077 domain-containing protein n=1 Tax=Thalassotalea loyana TaxID=280483 RepID=A0ABQ6HFX3_9GAMM|nr:hypothetical protein [Thalassotalea loyana]GLX86329.1 hypothetical protein tloyanaT_25820 [Thalassotalea loyana]